MKKILYFLLAFILSASLYAQVPNAVNYQGVVRNATGQPLANLNIKIKVSILSGSATGAVEYSATHSVTTNNFGLYNLAIGTGTVLSGNFGTIDWSLGNKFLKVEVDPAGGNSFVLSGTTQLLSVPYSLYAAKAGNTYWSMSNDDFLYKNSSGLERIRIIKDGPVNLNALNWDLTNTEGDFKIGNTTHRFKIGVATGGGGAGDVRLRAHGGTNRMFLGGGALDVVSITPAGLEVLNPDGNTLLRLRGLNNEGLISFYPYQDFFSKKNILSLNTSLIPDTNNTHDLGAPGGLGGVIASKRWRNIYLVNSPDVASDRRLKTNIKNINYGLSEIMKLRPVTYTLKSDPSEEVKLGLIAQEVKEVLPQIVSEAGTEKMMGVKYSDIIPVLIKAMQEQQAVINNLQSENKLLKSNFDKLESQISELINHKETKASVE